MPGDRLLPCSGGEPSEVNREEHPNRLSLVPGDMESVRDTMLTTFEDDRQYDRGDRDTAHGDRAVEGLPGTAESPSAHGIYEDRTCAS